MSATTPRTFSAGFVLLIAAILLAPAAAFVVSKQIPLLSKGATREAQAENVEAAAESAEAVLRRILPDFDSYPASDRRILVAIEEEFPDPEGRLNLSASEVDIYRWYHRLYIDNYLRFGHRDPIWDQFALTAFTLYARSSSVDTTVRGHKKETNTLRDALTYSFMRGCRDPYLMYAAERLRQGNTLDVTIAEKKPVKTFEKMIENLEKYPWPDYCRGRIYLFTAFAIWSRFQELGGGDFRNPQQYTVADIGANTLANFESYLRKAFYHMLRADMDLSRPGVRDVYYQQLNQVLNLYGQAFGDREMGFETLRKELAKVDLDPSVEHLIEGTMHISSAWNARGNGFASGVSDEKRKLFAKELKKAKASLKFAWETDSSNPRICIEMVRVAKGLGERDTMELWFERGVELEPGNFELHEAKFDFLRPRWHGSPEELLAFGRECADGGRWAERIPFILNDALEEVATYGGGELGIDYEAAWRGQAWTFEEYFEQCPHDNFRKSLFAFKAYQSGHPIESRDMILELGEDIVPWTEFVSSFNEFWHDIRAKVFAEATKEEMRLKKNPPKPKAETLEEALPEIPEGVI